MFDWLKKGSATPGDNDDNVALFDDEFQRRLEYLAIVARRLQSGRNRAERRSRKTGSGIEFADHRQYSPGDDLRYLDWHVYQRHGRLLLRLFEEEEDLSVYVLIDGSKSMSFGSPPKLFYAKHLAAALSYVALASLDRVSVQLFRDTMVSRLAPTRGKNRVFKVFEFLQPLRADGPTDLGKAMKAFVAQHKRRGVVIVISDLYDPSGFEDGINQLRYGQFEPHVIQLFDPSEVSPRVLGDVRLVDNETGEVREVTLTPQILRRYATVHREFRDRIRDFCTEKQVPYHPVETSTPFDDALLGILRRGALVA